MTDVLNIQHRTSKSGIYSELRQTNALINIKCKSSSVQSYQAGINKFSHVLIKLHDIQKFVLVFEVEKCFM